MQLTNLLTLFADATNTKFNAVRPLKLKEVVSPLQQTTDAIAAEADVDANEVGANAYRLKRRCS